MRREHIAGAVAADAGGRRRRPNDIRKFEEIGTHPAANHNAIAEALTLPRGHRHRAQGRAPALPARPLGDAARAADPKFRLHTSLDPAQSCAIGNVQIIGVPTPKVVARLWDEWRIIATPIVHAEYEGVRVTPNVYTTLEEIDTFADGDGRDHPHGAEVSVDVNGGAGALLSSGLPSAS